MIKEDILAFLASKKDEMAQVLQELIRFRTVSGMKDESLEKMYYDETRKCYEYIEDTCSRMDLPFTRLENEIAEITLGDYFETIGVPLHIDVVPGWEEGEYEPFAGIRNAEVIYGRGTQDNKGPLVSCLYGMWALKEAGISLKKQIKIIVAAEEETGEWEAIFNYVKKYDTPAFCFVPDYEFPIVNAEKGMLNVKLTAAWEREATPSLIEFVDFSGGKRVNIVTDKATARFSLKHDTIDMLSDKPEWMAKTIEDVMTKKPAPDTIAVTREFYGKGAHSSKPWDGHNALLDGLAFLKDCEYLPSKVSTLVQILHKTCSDMYGKGLDIDITHDFIGPLTISLGILSLKNGSLDAYLNIRPPINITCDEVIEKIRSKLDEYTTSLGFEIEVKQQGKCFESLWIDPEKNRTYIEPLRKAFTEITGRKAILSAATGTTFAKAFPKAVTYGPVDPENDIEKAHQADEHVTLDQLLRNAKIYALAMWYLARE